MPAECANQRLPMQTDDALQRRNPDVQYPHSVISALHPDHAHPPPPHPQTRGSYPSSA